MDSFRETVASVGLPSFLIDTFTAYPYALIFFCLLVGGGIILFPAFYLATLGAMDEWAIIGIMIIAAACSDAFWYSVGRGALPGAMQRAIEKSRSVHLKKLSNVVSGRELYLLFYSKFVFGTRIAVQVLCGSRKVPFVKTMLVSMFAVFILGLIYYGIVYITASGVNSLGDLRYKVVFALLGAGAVIGSLHFFLYRFSKKYIYGDKNRKPPG